MLFCSLLFCKFHLFDQVLGSCLRSPTNRHAVVRLDWTHGTSFCHSLFLCVCHYVDCVKVPLSRLPSFLLLRIPSVLFSTDLGLLLQLTSVPFYRTPKTLDWPFADAPYYPEGDPSVQLICLLSSALSSPISSLLEFRSI